VDFPTSWRPPTPLVATPPPTISVPSTSTVRALSRYTRATWRHSRELTPRSKKRECEVLLPSQSSISYCIHYCTSYLRKRHLMSIFSSSTTSWTHQHSSLLLLISLCDIVWGCYIIDFDDVIIEIALDDVTLCHSSDDKYSYAYITHHPSMPIGLSSRCAFHPPSIQPLLPLAAMYSPYSHNTPLTVWPRGGGQRRGRNTILT